MKLLHAFPFRLLLPVCILIGLILIVLLIAASNRITYATESFSESTEILSNPWQGFYHLIGYTLSDDYAPTGAPLTRQMAIRLLWRWWKST